MLSVVKFDRVVGRSIRRWPAGWRPAMRLVSLGGYQLLPPVLLATATFALLQDRPRLLWAAVLAGVLTVVNLILKQFIHRPRPDQLKLSTWRIESYSFPSGHSFGAVVCYGLLACLAWQELADPWALFITLILGLFSLAIGVSRVYLGVHYPTDVIGGWLLGGLSLGLIIQLTAPL